MDDQQIARFVGLFRDAVTARHGMSAIPNPKDAGEFYVINEVTGQVFVVAVREGRFVMSASAASAEGEAS